MQVTRSHSPQVPSSLAATFCAAIRARAEMPPAASLLSAHRVSCPTASASNARSTASKRSLALRDDVLRVRASRRPHNSPEDASWAVAPGGASAHRSRRHQTDTASTVTLAHLRCHRRADRARPHAHGPRLDRQHTPAGRAPRLLHRRRLPRLRRRCPPTSTTSGSATRPGPSIAATRPSRCGTPTPTASRSPPIRSTRAFRSSSTYRAGAARASSSTTPGAPASTSAKTRATSTPSAPTTGRSTTTSSPGPTPTQVVETYAWLTGHPPLPPLWTLGFQQSRYSYAPRAAAAWRSPTRLRADHIPADALYLDIDLPGQESSLHRRHGSVSRLRRHGR